MSKLIIMDRTTKAMFATAKDHIVSAPRHEVEEWETKPCPFCGTIDGVILEPSLSSYGRYDGYDIGCQNIYCTFQPSGWGETKKEAIDLWNKRSNNF